MNLRGVLNLLGFIALAVHWSRGDDMTARGAYTFIGFIACVLHSSSLGTR